MDFKEYLITRKKSKLEILYTALIYLAALVLAFLCLMFIPPIGGIWFLAIVGVFFFAYKFAKKFNREYEYIITYDIVDIDVIYNASSRKRLISFSVHAIEEIAPVTEGTFFDKNNFVKVINVTTNKKDAEVYSAIVEKEGRVLIYFEPPYSMLEIMKKLEPRKVIIKE